MDLSILIPVYKWDCSLLVEDLERQAKKLDISYEIIEADDEQLNMGRARIRNHLAEMAHGNWLLFLDCDAVVESSSFLKNYLDAAKNSKAKVICGGLHHAKKMPSEDVSLRWSYEHRADRHRAARFRKRHPYQSFTPFSFLIDREVFLSIRFDERIQGYGHEDTLFGCELAKQRVPIRHIDNPLLHKGLESNHHYLEKTRQALRTLHHFNKDLSGYSKVLTGFKLLRAFHLRKPAAQLFILLRHDMEENLTGPKPSVFLFELYKLGYYCHL